MRDHMLFEVYKKMSEAGRMLWAKIGSNYYLLTSASSYEDFGDANRERNWHIEINSIA